MCVLTDELVQEHQRGDVARQAQQLCHDHEPVPRLDGQRHHQQLRQDQGGEGDGHDVDELRLEEQQGAVHDDAPWGWGGAKSDSHTYSLQSPGLNPHFTESHEEDYKSAFSFPFLWYKHWCPFFQN